MLTFQTYIQFSPNCSCQRWSAQREANSQADCLSHVNGAGAKQPWQAKEPAEKRVLKQHTSLYSANISLLVHCSPSSVKMQAKPRTVTAPGRRALSHCHCPQPGTPLHGLRPVAFNLYFNGHGAPGAKSTTPSQEMPSAPELSLDTSLHSQITTLRSNAENAMQWAQRTAAATAAAVVLTAPSLALPPADTLTANTYTMSASSAVGRIQSAYAHGHGGMISADAVVPETSPIRLFNCTPYAPGEMSSRYKAIGTGGFSHK